MSTFLTRTSFCLFPLTFSCAHFRVKNFKFSSVSSSDYSYSLIRHRCCLIFKALCMHVIRSPNTNQILQPWGRKRVNLTAVWLLMKTHHESFIGVCGCQAMGRAAWEQHLWENTAAAEVKGFKSVSERQATELQINDLYHFKSWDIEGTVKKSKFYVFRLSLHCDCLLPLPEQPKYAWLTSTWGQGTIPITLSVLIPKCISHSSLRFFEYFFFLSAVGNLLFSRKKIQKDFECLSEFQGYFACSFTPEQVDSS